MRADAKPFSPEKSLSADAKPFSPEKSLSAAAKPFSPENDALAWPTPFLANAVAHMRVGCYLLLNPNRSGPRLVARRTALLPGTESPTTGMG